MGSSEVPEQEPGVASFVRDLLTPRRTAEAGSFDEGLRERKKRLMRQLISDTATVMFLERGFEEVRVVEIAEACEVSEKTIYNYFPTKESLVFDNEDDMVEDIRRAIGPKASTSSPVASMVELIIEDLAQQVRSWESRFPSAGYGENLRRFWAMIEHSPSLTAAWYELTERLFKVAVSTLAERAGMDPSEPEPRIAANAILGLWRVAFDAMMKHAGEGLNASQIRDAVAGDVRRAARLIDTGLWSFGLVAQGAESRDQLRLAAESADEARKQVVAALKQARHAFRQAAEARRAYERRSRPPR